MPRYGSRTAVPLGKAPVLVQRGGVDTVDTKCPLGHAAGLGHVAADYLDSAICPVCGNKLLPNTTVKDDR